MAGSNPIKPFRVCVVLAIAALIVGGHLFDIIRQQENWPFSHYPMYAKLIRKNQTSLLRLYGIVTDGRRVWEMPIVADNTNMYVQPVNELRMKNILDYAWTRDKANPKALRRVLRDYMVLYEERRILGRHATPEPGPRMLKAECKQLTWKLDAKGGAMGPPIEKLIATASAFRLLDSDPDAPFGNPAATLPAPTAAAVSAAMSAAMSAAIPATLPTTLPAAAPEVEP